MFTATKHGNKNPNVHQWTSTLIKGSVFTWQNTTTRQWEWMTPIHTKYGWMLKALLLLFSHSLVSDSLRPPWTAAHQASMSFTITWSLLKLMSIESVMPSNHLILCCPLLYLPSILPSIPAYLTLKSIVLSERNKTGQTIWFYLKYKSRENYSSMKSQCCGYS